MTHAAKVTVAAVLVTACSAHSHHTASRSPTTSPSPSGASTEATISGHLLAVGGPAPARPIPGRVQVVHEASWQYVNVGSDGAFSIALTPGTYHLTATSPLYNSGHAICNALQPVTVSAGQTVTADVLCQEK